MSVGRWRWGRRGAWRLPLGAIVVVLLASCSAQPTGVGSAGPGTTGAPRLDGRAMDACVISGAVPVEASVDGFCGRVQVPLDRANPAGPWLSLRAAVVPAADHAAPDPVFVLAGGPGDPSTSFFAWLPDHYAEVHARHDIVMVDQRGTGDSLPLQFPPAPDTSRLADRLAERTIAAWVTSGLATLPADPRFFTSTVAADDLDDVRAALGYDQIDLYGTSYGGTLAQYYLRQHGEHVRAAVLDGATPLDVPVMERLAANSQAALMLLLSRCEHDQACHAAYPDIAREWSTLQAGLAAGITTSVVDPETGAPAVVNLRVVGPSLHQALLTGVTAAQVPAGIHLAFEGRWEETGDVVPNVSTSLSNLVMANEIFCSEAWARFDPLEVRRSGAGSYAMPMFVEKAWTQRVACDHLPAGVVPADDGSAVRTDVPILWLTGDGDPQDPPANLTGVAATQPNSAVVVMRAQEHVVGHLGCGPTVIAAFLDAGTAAGLDTSCIAQGPAPAPTFRVP